MVLPTVEGSMFFYFIMDTGKINFHTFVLGNISFLVLHDVQLLVNHIKNFRQRLDVTENKL